MTPPLGTLARKLCFFPATVMNLPTITASKFGSPRSLLQFITVTPEASNTIVANKQVVTSNTDLAPRRRLHVCSLQLDVSIK